MIILSLSADGNTNTTLVFGRDVAAKQYHHYYNSFYLENYVIICYDVLIIVSIHYDTGNLSQEQTCNMWKSDFWYKHHGFVKKSMHSLNC